MTVYALIPIAAVVALTVLSVVLLAADSARPNEAMRTYRAQGWRRRDTEHDA